MSVIDDAMGVTPRPVQSSDAQMQSQAASEVALAQKQAAEDAAAAQMQQTAAVKAALAMPDRNGLGATPDQYTQANHGLAALPPIRNV